MSTTLDAASAADSSLVLATLWERGELVLRTLNPKDERTVIVTLTPKGQARVEVTFYR